jgi:hypothetical protein
MANALRSTAEKFDDSGPRNLGRTAVNSSYPQFRRALSASLDPRWQAETLARMTALLKMPAGWDSYSAVPIRHDAAMFALTILENVMRSGTPSPAVVPASDGGLQLEWHENEVDLEIHVIEPYKGEVWWRDHSTGQETSYELTADLSGLRGPIEKLSAS